MKLSSRIALTTCLACTACGDASDPGEASSTQSASGTLPIVVTPNTELTENQAVRVTSSGLTPGAEVRVYQCPIEGFPSAVPYSDPFANCELVRFSNQADASGRLDTSVAVKGSIYAGNNGVASVACQYGGCGIAFLELSGTEWPFSQIAPIQLRPPAQSPVLTLSQSMNLHDRQPIMASGSGFWAWTAIVFGQCRANATNFATECALLPYSGSRSETQGTFTSSVEPRYQITPAQGAAISCEGPGTCELFAAPRLATGIRLDTAARVPITFESSIGPVRRGSLALAPESSSPKPSDTLRVLGSGWAPNAAVALDFCNLNAFAQGTRGSFECLGAAPLVVTADAAGNFTASVPSSGKISTENLGVRWLTNCSTPDPRCGVFARDARALAESLATLPIDFTLPSRTAAVELQTALVPDLTVRVVGNGFPARQHLSIYECVSEASSITATCSLGATLADADATGAFRVYTTIRARVTSQGFGSSTDCLSGGRSCSLIVDDQYAPVTVPLTVTTPETIDVTSRYEPEWHALLDGGLEASGLLPAELQREGVPVTLWVLAASRTGRMTPWSDGGTRSYTSSYTLEEYVAYSHFASRHDLTLYELQKPATLFGAWLLAGKPPL
ncbi:MAG TPA: neocarzinostatin apoprotein domain-containing protein [Polyangiaceae bacterium]|nr:neocarzinostatin apoprotein domain-containing protein [Polyangiaceae bacterium]